MANVIVINPFEVDKGKEEDALASWAQFAAYFQKQPGYVSGKLHRAINPDARFHLVTVAEWESPETFMAALNNPELKRVMAAASYHPQSFPGLYESVQL